MKSRHRVTTYGEVLTRRQMVDRMFDMVREELSVVLHRLSRPA